MSLIPFPSIPNVRGVPQLPRLPGLGSSLPPVLGAAAAIGALWRALSAPPTWGIFKQPPPTQPDVDGVETVTVTAQLIPVVTVDSIMDFSYRNEYEISDFFIQDGAFASYNKVANPYENSVRLIRTGSLSDRAEFLNQLEALLPSLLLYQIITPERTYINVNPYRLEVSRRGAAGAYQLTEVDLYFREIRSVTAQYTTTAPVISNPQQPGDADPQNTGVVNADVPANPPDVSTLVGEP